MGAKFQIGDLVEFSFTHSIGIVMDIKKEPERILVLGVGIIYLPSQSPDKYCRRR